MGLSATGVEKAERLLEEAEARAREWIGLVDQRRRDLAAALDSDGRDVLASQSDNVDAATALARSASEVARLRYELEVAERVATEARSGCVGVQHAVWAAQANALRREAAAKRRDADARQPRTDRLLAELLEHEEVAFAPAVLHSDLGRGTWTPPTLTDRLRREAEELDRQADELAAKRVPTSGAVTGLGVDELLENLDALVPTSAVPAAQSVRAWAAAADRALQAESRRLERAYSVSAVLFELCWRDGRIDELSSSAQLMHVATPA